MLSALVITQNEEDVIGQCLDLLQWADECVVIDSGSTDATCEIARAHGARVIHNDWPGYGAQRNYGGEQCRGDWIVYAMMAGHSTMLAYAMVVESNMRAEQADRHDPSRDGPSL